MPLPSTGIGQAFKPKSFAQSILPDLESRRQGLKITASFLLRFFGLSFSIGVISFLLGETADRNKASNRLKDTLTAALLRSAVLLGRSGMETNPEDEQTEVDLLLTVACYGESEDRKERQMGEEAFVKLMNRHGEVLNRYVGALVQKYSTFRFDHEEMYSKLGEKIWRNAAKFEPKSEDPSFIRGKFLKWASMIRSNLFNDEIKAIHVNLDYKDFEELLKILPEAESLGGQLCPAAQILSQALSEMPQREQDILRALAASNPLDGTPLRTSSEDLKELAEHLGVTIPSLTTMRKRAIERLKLAIQELEAAT